MGYARINDCGETPKEILEWYHSQPISILEGTGERIFPIQQALKKLEDYYNRGGMMEKLNYPYWAGRFSGFLKSMKYHGIPEDLQNSIDELLAEWKNAHNEEIKRMEVE